MVWRLLSTFVPPWLEPAIAIRWYDQNVSDVSRRYESVPAETVHGWLVDLLPSAPALVLDVGAGTGRDAAWLASRGLEVTAVEPSGAMRTTAPTESGACVRLFDRPGRREAAGRHAGFGP